MSIIDAVFPPPAPPEPDAPGPVAVRWAKHPRVTGPEIGAYILRRRDAIRARAGMLDADDNRLEAIWWEKLHRHEPRPKRKPTAEERRRLAELREREATLFEASLKALGTKEQAARDFWAHVRGFAHAEWLSQESRSLEDASPHDPYTAYRREQVARYEELRAQLRAAEAAHRKAFEAWGAVLDELRALEAEVAE